MGITIETVRVRRAGNKPDTTGYGRVDNNYAIGKYEITISQYTSFLNAVAASDPYRLYNPGLMTNPINGGITRSGSDGSYVYSPITGTDQLPITGVSWFDAARFVNWLDNGQPSGASSEQTTEDGTYSLNGAINGLSTSRNSINPNTNISPQFAIPTENEWYKAAFYKPNRKRGSNKYYRYATQSNQAPGNKVGSDFNQVNYILDSNGFYSITQQPFVDTTQNYLSPVGSYTGSEGPFGTFDQNGGVWEVLDNGGVNRRDVPLRGGGWTSLASLLQSGYSIAAATESEAVNAGFRIVQLADNKTPERGQRAGRSTPRFAPSSKDASPSKQPLQTNEIELDLITIGNPNNQADPLTGFGAVSGTFQISSNVITIGQYTTFLNAVAKRDKNNLFNPMMQRDLNIAGIERLGQPGNYKYRTINNDGDALIGRLPM